MNPKVKEFIEYVGAEMPRNNKHLAQSATQARFSLQKDRSVYHCDEFAVRFCYSKNGSFSNVVLSLSALRKYDHKPFFVVLVNGNRENELFLANTTLLNKISHSSQQLSVDNIRGSFLGSNIIKDYDGIPNDAGHVEQLFAIHQGYTWQENIVRLVEATSGIKPVKARFSPDERQTGNIFSSVSRARAFVASPDYEALKADLDERVRRCSQSIWSASQIENVNIRGRLIEYLITSGDTDFLVGADWQDDRLPVYDTRNGLGDYVRTFDSCKAYTDIKTKIMFLGSSPKAYNIDKFLEIMSEDDSVFLFYLVGLGEQGVTNCVLASVYDRRLVDAAVFQHHWAGRGTRGAVQFDGSKISAVINTRPFVGQIDEPACKSFLEKMLSR